MFEIGIFLLIYAVILAYFLLRSPKPPSKPPSLLEIYTAGYDPDVKVSLEEVKDVLRHKEEDPLEVLEESTESGQTQVLESSSEESSSEIIELDVDEVPEVVEVEDESFDVIMQLSADQLKTLIFKRANSAVREIYEIFKVFKEDFTSPGWIAFLRALYYLTLGQDDSSVVSQRGKSHKVLDDSYKLLGQVTLSQHTKNVVHLMAVEVQKQSAIKAHICEAYLLSALMHDLGKSEKILSTFGNGMYRLVDHSMLIDAFLSEFYEDIDDRTARIKEEVKQAVLLHHQSSKVLDNDLAMNLKRADTLARQKEIEELTEEMPKLEEVLTRESLQDIILSALNDISVQCSGKPCVFSVKNYVLVNKKYVLTRLKSFFEKNQKLVKEVFYGEEELERALCEFLIEHKFASRSLLEHYVSVKRKNPAKKTVASLHFHTYWALMLESFGVLASTIEESKPPSLKLFIDIELRKRSI